MLQFLKCLLGFHGVTEIYHCKDGELKVCRDCLKVKKQPNVLRHRKPRRILDVDGGFCAYLNYPGIPEGWIYDRPCTSEKRLRILQC